MLLDAQNTGNTITEVLGWVREFSIIGAILTLAWKARGWWDSVTDGWERIERHMDLMEKFARSANDNHLKHIEDYLKKMANQQDLVDDLNRDGDSPIDES